VNGRPSKAAIRRIKLTLRRRARFLLISENSQSVYTALRLGAKRVGTDHLGKKLIGREPIKSRGDKRALMDMIVYCAELHEPLPPWVAQTVLDAHAQGRSGRLKSWDDVFGKPYRGKSQRGAHTDSRKFEVWLEVRRLRRQEKRSIGPALFEEVAKILKIGRKRTRKGEIGHTGGSTVSRLYYQMDKPIREEAKGDDF
jgi:hypothetical protein